MLFEDDYTLENSVPCCNTRMYMYMCVHIIQQTVIKHTLYIDSKAGELESGKSLSDVL